MANINVAYLTKDCIDEDGRLNYERIKFPKTARMKFNAKAPRLSLTVTKMDFLKYFDEMGQNPLSSRLFTIPIGAFGY